MPNLLTGFLQGAIFFLAVLVLIALGNLRALRPMGAFAHPRRWPRASVLLPARDEAGQNPRLCHIGAGAGLSRL